MPRPLPPALARLLDASEPAAREAAWTQLVADYSRIILHTARSFRGDYDAAMDRYACVLEQLRANDFHRLRTFVADGRSEFSTWLVVVAQHICLDQHRHRYGRGSRREEAAESGRDEEAAARRRLVDLVGAEIDVSSLTDGRIPTQEDAVRVAEVYEALETVLDRLEPRDRLLLKLRFEDGLSVSQIAGSLDVPTRFHVHRRLRAVLQRLQQELRKKGIRDPVP